MNSMITSYIILQSGLLCQLGDKNRGLNKLKARDFSFNSVPNVTVYTNLNIIDVKFSYAQMQQSELNVIFKNLGLPKLWYLNI